MFRYELIWNKVLPTNFFLAKKQPLKLHENILIFYNGSNTYNPICENKTTKVFGKNNSSESECYGNSGNKYKTQVGYPKSIITFRKLNNLDKDGNLHPTQKPPKLFEYLIRTYSKTNDLVFDGFAGSGTTAIAAINCDRNFICIEKEQKYFEIAKKRIEAIQAQLKLPLH